VHPGNNSRAVRLRESVKSKSQTKRAYPSFNEGLRNKNKSGTLGGALQRSYDHLVGKIPLCLIVKGLKMKGLPNHGEAKGSICSCSGKGNLTSLGTIRSICRLKSELTIKKHLHTHASLENWNNEKMFNHPLANRD